MSSYNDRDNNNPLKVDKLTLANRTKENLERENIVHLT